MVSGKKPGLRNSVSIKDPDVAASLRDLGSQVRGNGQVRVVSLSKVYTPPFAVGCDTLPGAVLCGRAKSRSGVDYVSASGVRWRWSSGELTIIEITGLTVGQAYDINMLVVF